MVAGAIELIEMGVYPFVVPFRPLAGTLATDVDGATAPRARRRLPRHHPGGRRAARRTGCSAPTRPPGAPPAAPARPSAPAPPTRRRREPRRARRRGRPHRRPRRTAPAPRRVRRRARRGAARSPPTAALRRDVFVDEQGLFAGSDRDDVDDDPRTIVLRRPRRRRRGARRRAPRTRAARPRPRLVARLAPRRGHRRPDAARASAPPWSAPPAPRPRPRGALRFDATVQAQNERLFRRLGWVPRERHRTCTATRTCVVDWPIARVQRLVDATKAALGGLLARPGRRRRRPASSATTAPRCPAPTWSPPATRSCRRWSSATPSGPAGARRWSTSTTSPRWAPPPSRCSTPSAPATPPSPAGSCAGSREASQAWGVPVLGGHTQLGVPGRALGHRPRPHRPRPVPGGGGAAGQALRVTADLGGGWRPRYTGAQWDSSSHRTGEELRALAGVVPALRPTAAKDVSMSGLVGTTGMLAEACGCRAVLDVAAVPAPDAGVVRRLADLLPRLRHGHRRAATPRRPRGAARLRHHRRLRRAHHRHGRRPALARRRRHRGRHLHRHRNGTAHEHHRHRRRRAPTSAATSTQNLAQISALVADARSRGVALLALPEACLGGYLSVLGSGRDGTPRRGARRRCRRSWTSTAPSCAAVAEIAREMTARRRVLRVRRRAAASTAPRSSAATACSACTARCTSRSARTCTTRPARPSAPSTRRSAGSAR